MATTLDNLLAGIRELSYDRFPVPCFYMKAKSGKYVTNDLTDFKILPAVGSPTPDHSFAFSAFPTMDALLQQLIGTNYPVSYAGYFLNSDSPALLIKYTDKSLAADTVFLRPTFLSDAAIKDLIVYYYLLVLDITLTVSDLTAKVTELTDLSARHLMLFVSILLVNKRQLADIAAISYDGQFTDGTGINIGGDLGAGNGNINVNVGSVFSLSEDTSILANYFSEDFNQIGSDNVLGNKNSFLFKLFLFLRSALEEEFRDYYFRKSNAMNSKVTLEKDLNFRAFFDSYPFTLSPGHRDIINRGTVNG